MFLKNAFYILSMMGFRHGQYDMAIGDAGQQASADEVGPSVGVSLSTGQAEAGFAGKSDASYLAAVTASVLDKAHLFGVTAVEHFLNGFAVTCNFIYRVRNNEINFDA